MEHLGALVSALPSASRCCSTPRTPRNATPRSAPLLASSRLCRSPHLDATQCSDARLGLSSLSAQRAALLRSSTRLCSSRRNAPPLATGPLLLRPGLEADLTMPTICRSDTAAEAPRARARTASSRSRQAFEPVFEWFSVDHGRTSPVEWPLFIAFHAHAASGCGLGRRSSIRRRIFVTSALIATSARWHTMQRPWRMDSSAPALHQLVVVSGEFALELPGHMPMAASGLQGGRSRTPRSMAALQGKPSFGAKMSVFDPPSSASRRVADLRRR